LKGFGFEGFLVSRLKGFVFEGFQRFGVLWFPDFRLKEFPEKMF
jgi:hypothetical protein